MINVGYLITRQAIEQERESRTALYGRLSEACLRQEDRRKDR